MQAEKSVEKLFMFLFQVAKSGLPRVVKLLGVLNNLPSFFIFRALIKNSLCIHVFQYGFRYRVVAANFFYKLK